MSHEPTYNVLPFNFFFASASPYETDSFPFRDESAPGFRAQPLERRARVVQQVAVEGPKVRRLLRLEERLGVRRGDRGATPAQQLGQLLRRARMDVEAGEGAVLPSPVHPWAA